MKAQDYATNYLPQITEAVDEKALKDIASNIFIAFLDDTAELVKSRNAIEDDAIISIINEESDKWHKFCRLINAGQTRITFNENTFLNYWRERLEL